MSPRPERWLGIVAGLAAGLALLWYLWGPRIQETLAEPESAPAPAQPEPDEATPRYPVPDAAGDRAGARDAPADPAATDPDLRRDAAAVFGRDPVETFLIPQRIVQNVVATLDSLDRAPVPLRFRAIRGVAGLPVVEQSGDTLALTEENGDRYSLLVAALAQTEARAIAGLYFRYYPLLQQAYRELGYPQGHLNDRVVQIIDHLLATPEVAPPIALVRPKVLYEFADPALEARSSGQKALIRMGPANAAIVKAKLREVRTLLTANAAGTAPRPDPGG